MTPRQFFVLFDIPERWYFKSKKKNVWSQVIKQFQQWDFKVVEEKLASITTKKGASPWYYVEAVRRQLLLEQHESYKKAPTPPAIKQILKGMTL